MYNAFFYLTKNNEKSNSYPPSRILLLLLFVASFVIRFCAADFEKIIIFYPDELLYYQIAENIAHGNFLNIYNLPTAFQKILYSLCLAPAFFFESIESQSHSIAAINALLVSSIIFPTYFIGKLFFENKNKIIFICFLSILLSDLSYSVTFMSENLFLPLGAWLFYFFIKIILENRLNILLSILSGILSYALYLCKEVGILLLAAFCAYIVFAKILHLKINFKEQIKNAFFLVFIFTIVFILSKLTFFYGLNNSYPNQASLSILKEEGRILFLFYGFFYYLLNILLGGCFFLVALPALYYKSFNEKTKQLFIFTFSIILVTSITIAYSVTVREDFNLPFPRAHLRYLVYIWIPFLCLFLALFENKLPKLNLKQKAFLILSALLMVLFYKGTTGSGDHTMLGFVYLLLYVPQLHLFWLFKIFLLGITILFAFQIKNKKIFLKAFLIFFIALQLFNNIYFSISCRANFEITPNEKTEIAALKHLIQNNPNKTFLVVGNGVPRAQRALDSFLNFPNIATISIANLKSGVVANFAPAPLVPSASYLNYSFMKIDYFIFPNTLEVKMKNSEKILNAELWRVFENKNNQTIPEFSFEKKEQKNDKFRQWVLQFLKK